MSTIKIVVCIETTNPDALDQLKHRLEYRPLDTDNNGKLHPLTVSITDTNDTLLWASVWEPEDED
jgi:hypothetical protein